MCKRILFKTGLVVICLSLAGIAVSSFINYKVKSYAEERFLYAATDYNEIPKADTEELTEFGADCIIILGAGIYDSETPAPMLKDRLDLGIELYEKGVAPKLLLSGDNGQEGYNEIHVMLSYAKKTGVPDEDIFCDHAGFSTYDSMYRAKSIFDVEKAIVVTQSYHEYRALYIGEKSGLEVRGAASDQQQYGGQVLRDLREFLARNRDFLKVMIKAESLIGGEVIPISGSGLISHGE